MINLFWKQWKGSYLRSLVSRRKWTTPTRNLAEGDFVMEAEEGVRRGQWRTGRVSRVHPVSLHLESFAVGSVTSAS